MRRSPLPPLLPLLSSLLVMTLALDIACGPPPPAPPPPPLPAAPPLIPPPPKRKVPHPVVTSNVRQGSLVAIDNVFTIEAPETAILRRGFGDEGQPYGVFVEKTFHVYFMYNVPAAVPYRFDKKETLQIDGRDAVVIRYREGRRQGYPGKFWLTAQFDDIYNEHIPGPDGNVLLLFSANAVNAETLDMIEQMVRSVRFLSKTRPEWTQ